MSRCAAAWCVLALLAAGSGSWPAGGRGEPSPVVSRLHTLSIHVRSHAIHEALHTLLAETLRLPRTYEPVTYGTRRYVAVWAGNIALEPCGPYPADNYLSTDFEAIFYGLTFAPWKSYTLSAAALDDRGILHGKPGDTLPIDDRDLRAPDVYVGIGWVPSREEVRRSRAALAAVEGGSIGVVRVGEVRIGYADEESLRKWRAFLSPAERVGESGLRVADGPVLRFVSNDTKQVLGITLEVRSLEKAAAFLQKEGLLGETTPDSVELDRARTHGLSISLRR